MGEGAGRGVRVHRLAASSFGRRSDIELRLDLYGARPVREIQRHAVSVTKRGARAPGGRGRAAHSPDRVSIVCLILFSQSDFQVKFMGRRSRRRAAPRSRFCLPDPPLVLISGGACSAPGGTGNIS
ncbi:hypothetical protein EVAR_19560_1 [Eumeta japonica]|uniref:Uncharacterized protein n=1 Tax=Eumeta variegata TaxID=151549 RepID=A0A4C1UG04_EUMVA|nr:hypothetical protein EVAR_19560_1 [Eumeta japonica]